MRLARRRPASAAGTAISQGMFYKYKFGKLVAEQMQKVLAQNNVRALKVCLEVRGLCASISQ